MELRIDWMEPVFLTDGGEKGPIYWCDLMELPDVAGVYVFGRQFGRKFEALYVGKSRSIRKRVKQQFNNASLMKHIQEAKHGSRVIRAGCFGALKGQQEDRCLPLIELAVIRYFLSSEAHDLVNVHGARLRQHSIHSLGENNFISPEILLDRK